MAGSQSTGGSGDEERGTLISFPRSKWVPDDGIHPLNTLSFGVLFERRVDKRPEMLRPILAVDRVKFTAPRGHGALGQVLVDLRVARAVSRLRCRQRSRTMPDQPRLPRAGEARIATDKLVAYALDPSHEQGQHKARVFASALGIRAKDWRYLHDQILAALPHGVVRGTRITAFGVAYEVVVMIDGLNGRTAPVVTTWMVERDGPPRLTSTWADIP